MISFAFDNADVINLLRRRGAYIKDENYDSMRRMDDKIDYNLQKNRKKLTRPVTAFVTLENEEGVNRAINFNEAVEEDEDFAHLRKFLGEDLVIEETCEPTDIIWENRHFTALDRFYRGVIVFTIIFFMLSISFFIIYWLTAIAYETAFPYMDCVNYGVMYGGKDGLLPYAF